MATLPMNLHIKQRRGTTEAIGRYAGEVGELLVDTTKQTVVLPSGTAGVNTPLAKESLTVSKGLGIDLKVNGVSANSATLAEDFQIVAVPSDMIEANGGIGVDPTSGKLKAAFNIAYAAATGVFTIYGADNSTVLGTVTLPTHLSVLKSVSFMFSLLMLF